MFVNIDGSHQTACMHRLIQVSSFPNKTSAIFITLVKDQVLIPNSFLANGDFCHLLITLTNCLDPDQDRHNVGPDMDLNSLTF